jgi:tRNA-dihydrouridine synthase A
MMDWSDRHCRFFWRQLSRHARLYTEMVTTGAVLHGDRQRMLDFDPQEHPVALQLGGSDPAALAACARLAGQWGYDEVNLNCGCPSDRVQNNMIGACLMAHAPLVADCLKAMQDACSLPVTVKHRIGIDEHDSYEAMRDFVGTLADTGCKIFIVHARKAWLQGLSPKENREIPPLRYEDVYRLKRELPQLTIVLNGGIDSLDACETHLRHVDGVMLGRSAYHNPWLLAAADPRLFGAPAPVASRAEAIDALLPYVERHLAAGGTLHHISRHLLGLYHNVPGARSFRRHLSVHGPRARSIDVLHEALAQVQQAAPDPVVEPCALP